MKEKQRGHATNKWSEDSSLHREFLALATPSGFGGIKVLGHGKAMVRIPFRFFRRHCMPRPSLWYALNRPSTSSSFGKRPPQHSENCAS
jgi:hypothetical protein